jgi:DNA end-binding protein Ku
MAARSTWKGFLKVSLVSIPIKVYPASEPSGTLSFNQLHAECRTRIQQKRWCPTCNREVANTELVKGYEFEKGRFVVLGEEDFSKVTTPSTRVIDLVQFADAEKIDPIYYDRAYYLAPDGPMATGAYAVMREGMRGKAGIGKVALYGREYLVAVVPREQGLVMFTLHHAAEVRPIEAIDELRTVPTEVKPDEVKLAKQVIGAFDGELDLSSFRDEYREGLREIIDKKIAGEEVVAKTVEMPANVVNLMDALRRSLDAAGPVRGKKRTAKAELPQKEEPAAAEEAPAAQAGARGETARRGARAPRAAAADRKRKAS